MKNHSGRDEMVKETVAGDKARPDEKWDSTEYSTPGKDIGWQNSTAKFGHVSRMGSKRL